MAEQKFCSWGRGEFNHEHINSSHDEKNILDAPPAVVTHGPSTFFWCSFACVNELTHRSAMSCPQSDKSGFLTSGIIGQRVFAKLYSLGGFVTDSTHVQKMTTYIQNHTPTLCTHLGLL